MIVVDANEVNGAGLSPGTVRSPCLHPAIHNVLDGLSGCDSLRVDVLYGRRNPQPGEERREGCVQYIPVPYRLPCALRGGAGYFARTRAILRKLRNLAPDLVHAQGTEREAGMVAALCGRPSLLTLHGNFQEIARQFKARPFSYLWVNARLERFVIPRVTGLVCISEYTRILTAGLNPMAVLLPNAVSESFFRIENRPRFSRVVCIGSIESRKNQVAFLRGMDAVASRIPDLSVHFWGPAGGDPDYFQEFQDEIAKRPWALYQGATDPSTIPGILTKADVLALPSIEDNCPVVVLEALAAAVPVVATAVGGVPDLVSDGETGFLVPTGEMSLMAERIHEVVTNRALRGKLSVKAAAVARERFSPQEIAKGHLRFYRHILEQKPRQGGCF